jgi:hypothetical protein
MASRTRPSFVPPKIEDAPQQCSPNPSRDDAKESHAFAASASLLVNPAHLDIFTAVTKVLAGDMQQLLG